MKRVLISSMAACLFLSGVRITNGQVLSQGPNDPGNATYEFIGCLACPGGEWIKAPYAMLADNIFTVVPLAGYPLCFQTSCYYSRGLIADEFKFNIPLNATISGIRVELLRKGYTTHAILDSSVFLLKNGQTAGVPKVSSDPWPLIPVYSSFGDSTDLWGASWTPAEVNAKQFGVYIKAMNKSGTIDSAAVDHIAVMVYYTLPVSAGGHVSLPGLVLQYDPVLKTFVVGGDGDARHELSVTDAAGRIVFRGCCRESYSLRDLPPGIYVASVFLKNSRSVLKLAVY